MGGGWSGPSVTFTSPLVAAPVHATVRYSGVPGVWVVWTDQLTVAGAIYTLHASFYLVPEAQHVPIPADSGHGSPQISVVPARAEVRRNPNPNPKQPPKQKPTARKRACVVEHRGVQDLSPRPGAPKP